MMRYNSKDGHHTEPSNDYLSDSTNVTEHARLYAALTLIPDCVREIPMEVYLKHSNRVMHLLAFVVGQRR